MVNVRIAVSLVVIIGLLAGVAPATPVANIQWNGPAAATNYTTSAANWTPNGIPNAAFDNVIVSTPAANILIMPTSGSYTVGQFTVTGTGTVRIASGATSTFTVTNSDNLTGNVSILTGSQVNSSSMTWNVYGDWRLGTNNSNFDAGVQQLNLYGTNKFVQKGGIGNNGVNYGAATDGYVINTDIYGSYANDPSSSTDIRTWRFQNLKVKSTGAINGGFWAIRTLQVESGGQLINNVANPTKFYFFGRCDSGTASVNDNTNFSTGFAGGRLALPGGVTFPSDVELGSTYSFGKSGTAQALYVWKMAVSPQSINSGDLSVRGNFYIGRNTTSGVRQGYIAAFDPCDNNALATPRNASIVGNLMIGSVNSSGHKGILYIDDSNTSSVIDVDGNVQVGYGAVARTTSQGYGSLHLGGGTLRVGGNWTVLRNATRDQTEFLYQNWNPGTSTVIYDGNGTVKTQVLYTDNMPFYNLVVHTPVGGTVRLSQASDAASAPLRDFIRVNGSLRLEQGSFNDQDRAITFAGGGNSQTLFWDNSLCKVTGNSLDNVILSPASSVTLDTGTQLNKIVLIDNIDLGSGSKLFLAGTTLKADGHTWVSAATPATGVSWDQGTIYGTLSVPEPATVMLLGTGLAAGLGWARRRRMK